MASEPQVGDWAGDGPPEYLEPPEMPANPIPLINTSREAPTVFADAVWFASYLGGVVRIQFIENQLEASNSADPGLKARHVGTVAIPKIGFKGLVKYLADMEAIFDQIDAAEANAKNVAP